VKKGKGAANRRQQHIARRRWLHDVERQRLKGEFWRRQAETRAKTSDKPYRSSIMDLLSKEPYVAPKRRPKGGVLRFEIPTVFSLSRNSEETIRVLKTIATAARRHRVPRVVLDHRKVTYNGLGADTVLGLVLSEIQQESKATSGAYIKGFKPKDRSIQRMMEEVGAVRALNDFGDRFKVDFRSTSRVFRFHNRHKSGIVDPLELDVVTRTVRKFADHLNECLSLIGKELSDDGMQRLLEYVSEVLSNADEHSRTADWAAVAYIDGADKDLIYRSVIVSIGATMAENFESLPRDSYAWDSVKRYVESHESKGFFGNGWSPADLLTVVALQGDISSENRSAEDTRGQGTVDLIEFFQAVRAECSPDNAVLSEMHILSGSSLIKFDGTYPMKKDEEGRSVIAFNSSNSLDELPDRKYVKALRDAVFPGVMISVAIPLAGTSLQQMQEA
jgi:hypothetical protein